MTKAHGGKSKTWEARASILGFQMFLGTYEHRSEAIFAEQVAGTIRHKLTDHMKAVERKRLIDRYKFKEAIREMQSAETECVQRT